MMAHFDALDCHGRRIDAQHAGSLARGGADAAGELGKIVRLVQAVERLAPQAAIDEVVPFGDQIVDRTAGRHAGHQVARVAKRNAAIHAAGSLIVAAPFSLMCSWNSFQSRIRKAGSRSGGVWRQNSVNPVGLPIGGGSFFVSHIGCEAVPRGGAPIRHGIERRFGLAAVTAARPAK